MTGPNLATRQLVIERDHGRCLRCGGPMESIHHRKPRGMGGTRDASINSPVNLVSLCGHGTAGCHGWIESHRDAAYRDGWLVRRNEDPAEVLIRTRELMVLLFEDGGMAVSPWT